MTLASRLQITSFPQIASFRLAPYGWMYPAKRHLSVHVRREKEMHPCIPVQQIPKPRTSAIQFGSLKHVSCCGLRHIAPPAQFCFDLASALDYSHRLNHERGPGAKRGQKTNLQCQHSGNPVKGRYGPTPLHVYSPASRIP